MTCPNCGAPLNFSLNGATGKWCSERCRSTSRRGPHSVFNRDFVGFDGEGITGDGRPRYILLADSTGRYVRSREGLSTKSCLDFLLDGQRDVNNIWYGCGYDVNMMLHDLPLEGLFGSYEALHRLGETRWGDYYIRYIPRKQFLVSKGEPRTPDYRSFNSYDVQGFFQTNFVAMCKIWLGSIPPIIAEGKACREEFATWPLGQIHEYNEAELTALVAVMNQLREAMRRAGLLVSRWDGAGATAAAWLHREKAKLFFASWPQEMNIAVARGFFGGRIDSAAFGSMDCGQSDIHSAYPSNMRRVPDLTRLVWRFKTTRALPDEPFALVFVRWHVPDNTLWGPLPYRTRSGTILFPTQGSGWYYAVEAAAAAARFPRGIYIEKAWVPYGPYTTPLAAPIERDFALRRQLQAAGDPAERAIKLALNSQYGKTAQRQVNRFRTPPFQNYLWAGYITAQTRAQLNEAIREVGESSVFATMTDGLLLRDSLPSGDELGMWSRENVASAAVLGPGIYRTYESGGQPHEHRNRGFSREPIPYEDILDRWWGYDFEDVAIPVNRFIGMGLALASSEYRKKFLTFSNLPRMLACPLMVGTSKRLPIELVGKGRRYIFLPPRPALSNEPSYSYVPATLEVLQRNESEQEHECDE